MTRPIKPGDAVEPSFAYMPTRRYTVSEHPLDPDRRLVHTSDTADPHHRHVYDVDPDGRIAPDELPIFHLKPSPLDAAWNDIPADVRAFLLKHAHDFDISVPDMLSRELRERGIVDPYPHAERLLKEYQT